MIGPTCRSCWSVCLSVWHINTKHDLDDDADQAYDVDVDDDYNEDDDHDKNDDTDYDNDKFLRWSDCPTVAEFASALLTKNFAILS